MAEKIIFDGDVSLSGKLNTYTLFTAKFPLIKFIDSDLTVAFNGGTPYVLSYSRALNIEEHVEYLWQYQENGNHITIYGVNDATATYIMVYGSIIPGSGTYHVTITGEMTPPKPVTYSATQNGGSIYDNLVELYNSITGEDPKGHSPSEVIDELKGKIGGGSSGNKIVFEIDEDSNAITCDKSISEVVRLANSGLMPIATILFDGDFADYSVLTYWVPVENRAIIMLLTERVTKDGIDCVVLSGSVKSTGDSWSEVHVTIPITIAQS